ncbi:hypothetical protein ACFVH6_39910 [Spirillospora sp. NPDC127200]
MTRDPEPTTSPSLRWPTFLRLDRPELDGNEIVIRAGPVESRARTRNARSAPLAYLYELVSEFEPDTEVRLAAGHYDAENMVWVFSDEVPGIVGITQPTSA